ncbi:MAG: hypothetical protein LBF95_01175 [Treponema sp.]|jgi:hypothetical protein|nr:hypothetical protein [Treponema sp.]
MVLQKLIGSIYSIIVEILLWVLPIVGFVVAGIVLSGWGSSFHLGYAILGLIGGVIVDVVAFGPIVILFNIRASLKNIENK